MRGILHSTHSIPIVLSCPPHNVRANITTDCKLTFGHPADWDPSVHTIRYKASIHHDPDLENRPGQKPRKALKTGSLQTNDRNAPKPGAGGRQFAAQAQQSPLSDTANSLLADGAGTYARKPRASDGRKRRAPCKEGASPGWGWFRDTTFSTAPLYEQGRKPAKR